jgi:hypothetical protein
MRNVDFDRCAIGELLEEFTLLRRSHLLMLGRLEPRAWERAGVVSNHRMTTRAMAFVIAGHAKHHIDIVRARLAGGEP